MLTSGTVPRLVAPSLSVTVPVGTPVAPVSGTTVAVNVTWSPNVEGFGTAEVIVVMLFAGMRARMTVLMAPLLSMVIENLRPPNSTLAPEAKEPVMLPVARRTTYESPIAAAYPSVPVSLAPPRLTVPVTSSTSNWPAPVPLTSTRNVVAAFQVTAPLWSVPGAPIGPG